MAMRWHPDRPQNHARAEEATGMFQASKEAFDYLMQDLNRKQTLATRAPRTGGMGV